ncbi:hypothetical protein BT96DRAFT_359448 [Gymnopus androsaceus JB14]|uniref:F-box domain-containing protein n=1 Tax=Gymnopus androsaceus JB14 TaxID=1447944 RepID=A0A6A4I3X0_9AGAR|nr:hypothetical protein BT96DRAFT_359448 [Gymnopus androsaceus JB14]
MNPNDFGFNALPLELYHLIAQHIPDDVSTFCALTRVSRRAYEAFNPILYEKTDTLTLSTLALTDKARHPLTAPHPATLVKSMVFEYPYINPSRLTHISALRVYSKDEKPNKLRPIALAPTNPTTFLKLVSATIKNVIFYGASIKSLEYRCEGLEALCSSSLTSFELDLADSEGNAPTPSAIAKILWKVQKSSSNITRLRIYFGSASMSKSDKQPFRQVFNNPTFIFLF